MVSNVDFGRILIRISKYIKQMSVRAVMSTRVAAEPGSEPEVVFASLFGRPLHLFSTAAPTTPLPSFFLPHSTPDSLLSPTYAAQCREVGVTRRR